jgi:hypothetical protein
VDPVAHLVDAHHRRPGPPHTASTSHTGTSPPACAWATAWFRFVAARRSWVANPLASARASRDRYEEAALLTGYPAGSPQDALDTACTVHLPTEPS